MVTPPFLNMAYVSFTFEVWMYAQSLWNSNPYTDNAIFGQYEQNSTDKSFYVTIRNLKAYFGFYLDDAVGNQVEYFSYILMK